MCRCLSLPGTEQSGKSDVSFPHTDELPKVTKPGVLKKDFPLQRALERIVNDLFLACGVPFPYTRGEGRHRVTNQLQHQRRTMQAGFNYVGSSSNNNTARLQI